MFTSTELFLLKKLLHKIKYSDLDICEINEFANSPITNQILEKLIAPKEIEKEQINHRQNAKKFFFEFNNHVGNAIKNRLIQMDDSVFPVIEKWNRNEVEEFALDILGPIDYEKSELDKLIDFLIEISKKKTSR
ncbi:hypothetical protein FEDK69T_31160 [Flavobacterium enshiense DK69]|uniref:Uncharacterized protein n=1 Tax=Flavobacterium enshiense DK69 TaxID=1107311 RepID=V6S0C4_9FLAO|nr:hypothetical protein [Flavobacterium enshiense]ESU19859.1 hypothetical protein FEDK69T_31160 [Flavobacterium enshiense DK69]KGO92296.1 hypothetical protein Q767_15660 [Flavobacterium enshiense DK69]